MEKKRISYKPDEIVLQIIDHFACRPEGEEATDIFLAKGENSVFFPVSIIRLAKTFSQVITKQFLFHFFLLNMGLSISLKYGTFTFS